MFPVPCVLTLSSWSSLSPEAAREMVIWSGMWRTLFFSITRSPLAGLAASAVLPLPLLGDAAPSSWGSAAKLQKTLKSLKH